MLFQESMHMEVVGLDFLKKSMYYVPLVSLHVPPRMWVPKCDVHSLGMSPLDWELSLHGVGNLGQLGLPSFLQIMFSKLGYVGH